MEYFRKLMSAIGLNSAASGKVDFISKLPTEISQHIIRLLDAQTQLNVAVVSRKWHSVCQGDYRIRRSVRHHLRKQKRKLSQVTKITKKSNNIHPKGRTRISQSLEFQPTFENMRFVQNFEVSRSSKVMIQSSSTRIAVSHRSSVTKRIVMLR